MNDAVNHPSHYTSDPSGVECIQITRHRNFNIGNAIKYLWRNGLKDSDAQIQDLEKAIWYINDEIERLKVLEKNKQYILDKIYINTIKNNQGNPSGCFFNNYIK